jgi:hypothetical protein
MRFTGNAACVWERFLAIKPQGRDHIVDLRKVGRIILKWS